MEKLRPFSDELLSQVLKYTPLEKLEKSLRPRAASNEGFLGPEESLIDVISNDLKTVQEYETTYSDVANSLANLMTSRDASLLHPDYQYLRPEMATMGDQLCPWGCDARGQNAGVIMKKGLSEDDYLEARLSQLGNDGYLRLTPEWKSKSAFFRRNLPDDVMQRDNEYTEQLLRIVENKKNKDREVFYAPLTGLLPHLIKTHGFFEGRESPYRADPEFLIRALQLS